MLKLITLMGLEEPAVHDGADARYEGGVAPDKHPARMIHDGGTDNDVGPRRDPLDHFRWRLAEGDGFRSTATSED